MIKVLYIAYYFPPLGGGGVQRSLKFVEQLPSEGILPIVLTGPLPSYSAEDYWAPRDTSLMASLSPEVQIHRVDGKAPAGSSWQRFCSYFMRPSAFATWWTSSVVRLGTKVGHGANLVFATMSPFESGVAASEVSRRLGIPWVADLRDPWALDEVQSYPTELHRRRELRTMATVLSTASAIVMNAPEAAATLKRRIPGLRCKRILTITNGFDDAEFLIPPVPRIDGLFRIVHTGTFLEAWHKRLIDRLLGRYDGAVDLSTYRSPAFLLEAADRWAAQNPTAARETELVFAGVAPGCGLGLSSKAEGTPAVRCTGYLPHDDSLELVRSADLLFLPMQNLPVGKRSTTVPGKAYEYMAAGRPILAAVPDGDARDFLVQCGTAHLCRPNDVSAMADILENVYRAWKLGKTEFRQDRDFVWQFERRNLTRSLAVCLREVTQRG